MRDTVVAVTDLVGWRRESAPTLPDDQRFEALPDRACEILSPWTQKLDRIKKLSLYARHSVEDAWLVDPLTRTLEAFYPARGRLAFGRFATGRCVGLGATVRRHRFFIDRLVGVIRDLFEPITNNA